MSKTLAPFSTTRDPKGIKFISIVEAAYNKAKLRADEAQRVNNTHGLAKLIGDFIAKNRTTDEFSDEQVGSSSGYKKPMGVKWQSNRLRELFDVGFHSESAEQMLVPKGAEGLFVIPRWQVLGATYNEALKKVVEKLEEVYGDKFKNLFGGELGPEFIRETTKKKKAFKQIAKAQAGHDLLVVPAQFGIRHRGRTVRRARAVMRGGEFGLGAYEVGIMLLLHPERFKGLSDLCIDCAGDEASPGADGDFSGAPFFYFDGDRVQFHAYWFVGAYGSYGSASAFLPQ